MTTDPAPPEWAERVLQAFLTSRSFENVSGDLLEEYRDSVFPARGRHGADAGTWVRSSATGGALRHRGR